MRSPARPYLDFYSQNDIIPVRQDTTNLARHFNRRRSLYRHLGIVPVWLRGKRIIEIGPGSGDNAIYTCSLKPEKYVLVDGNPASIDMLNAKCRDGELDADLVDIRFCDATQFSTLERFDLVLCEGLIPNQNNPAEFLKHIAEMVDDGGVLVITNMTVLSSIPEICRRAVKPILERNLSDNDDLVAALADFFAPDLNNLPGMSRRHEDWVQDTIMHPWNAETIHFPLSDAIKALSDEFDVYGSSPSFMTDWRWYKNLNRTDNGVNQRVLEQYEKVELALLDCRVEPQDVGDCDLGEVVQLARDAFKIDNKIFDCGDVGEITNLLEVIGRIAAAIKPAMPETSKSLDDYIKGMDQLLRSNGTSSEFGTFRALWAHAQQYASFIRRPGQA